MRRPVSRKFHWMETKEISSLTGDLDCIVLLALEDIQQPIDKPGLRLGLTIGTTCEPGILPRRSSCHLHILDRALLACDYPHCCLK